MKKQIIIIAIVIFLISVVSTLLMYEPFNTEKNKFIGMWISTGDITQVGMTFFSDGTATMPFGHVTWDIKDGKLVILTQNKNVTFSYSYQFTNNNTHLKLDSESEHLNFIKQ